MKQMYRIGRLVLIALGAVIVLLAGKALIGVPGNANVLNAAIYLDEPVLLAENEGKMVIIHGPVEMIRPAYDEEMDLTLRTVKAYRIDQEYRQSGFTNDEKKWEWMSVGSKTIVGSAKIGQFNLDETTLTAFPAGSDYRDFDAEEIRRNEYLTDTGISQTDPRLYVLINAEYYYWDKEYSLNDNWRIRSNVSKTAKEREGAQACNYKYFDLSRYGEMTVAGIQQGDQLLAHDTVGAVVHDGKLDKDEIVNTSNAYLIGGSGAFLVIGLLLICLGLRKGRKNTKKIPDKTRKKG